MTVTWRGVFPAATTQFHDNASLDLESTAHHLEKLIQAGVHGLIMLGTVGENGSLDYQEKLDVLRMAVRQAKKRVPVLTGVAECSTALACRFAADAR
jgi:4-hydroxy-tetrahydrodipicolinate synthase